MQLGQKAYLACDGTDWLLVTVVTNQEKRPQAGDGYGKCTASKRSLVRGPSEDILFSGNVKSYSVNGLCGRQSIFSDCLSPFKSVHFFHLLITMVLTNLFFHKNVFQNTLIFVGGCSVY